jgi:hypothetical protein
LRLADPLSKESYRLCKKLKKLKSSQGPQGLWSHSLTDRLGVFCLAIVYLYQNQRESSHNCHGVHNTVRNSNLSERSVPFKLTVTLLGSITTSDNENIVPIFKGGRLFIGDDKLQIA